VNRDNAKKLLAEWETGNTTEDVGDGLAECLRDALERLDYLEGSKQMTIVCGSRSLTGAEGMMHVVRAIERVPWRISRLLHGAAEGIDLLAAQWAKSAGIWRTAFPAEEYDSPLKRNEHMAEKCDWPGGRKLIAIWDGESTGTMHMVQCAKERDFDISIYNVPQEEGQGELF